VDEVIVGRGRELDVLTGFVADVREGPRGAVLDGEPGIGKTTLFEACVDAARDASYQVLRTTPAEAEASFAFGGLRDILGPILPAVGDSLPPLQLHALGVAFLEEEAPIPIDGQTVSAGALAALRSTAERGPVLLAIDDAQWLDPATDRAIAYALRRIDQGPIGVLIAHRAPDDGAARTQTERSLPDPTLHVPIGPFGPDEIGAIIEQRTGVRPAARELDEIYRQSEGNPFYAVELARAVDRGDARPTGLSLPIPKTLRDDLIRGRLAALSSAAVQVLLLSAAATRPTVDLLGSALPSVTLDDALDESERASLLRVERGKIRFTHPLLRSAIYADASRSERHRAHAAIAAVVSDTEERGLHLALSSDVPDEAVATEIETGARAARARGAPAAAADLLGHAIRLTPADRSDALSRRYSLSAEDRFRLGDAGVALTDAQRAVSAAESGPARAAALDLVGAMEYWADEHEEARKHLEEALAQPDIDDRRRCALCATLFWSSRALGDQVAAYAYADRALALARSLDERQVRAPAYDAAAVLKTLREGGLAVDLMAEAPELWEPMADVLMSDWPLFKLAAAFIVVDKPARARELIAQLIDIANDTGDEYALMMMLLYQAELETRGGQWREGLETARRAHALARGPLHSDHLSRLVWLEAALGDEAGARADAERQLSRVERPTSSWLGTWILGSLVMLELSLGRAEAALVHGERLLAVRPEVGYGDPGMEWFLPDLIEALIAVGRTDEAEAHVLWLEERGATLDRPSALATGARGRGSVLAARGDLEPAASSVERAVKEHERLSMPYELARTLLVQGSVRRRAGEKRAARETLEHARSIFARIGGVLWVQRVDAELGHITGRRPGPGKLTDTERNVARLAAAGFRNREIAEQLFLSVRTVEGHLSDTYGKLGIRSRTELTTYLDDLDEAAPPRTERP
jgi:DNA-binding CsgD family transcriptional regulator